jgi:hypothetical protein
MRPAGTFSKKSRVGGEYARPRPGELPGSTIVTLTVPVRRRWSAASTPEHPPPMTTTERMPRQAASAVPHIRCADMGGFSRACCMFVEIKHIS